MTIDQRIEEAQRDETDFGMAAHKRACVYAERVGQLQAVFRHEFTPGFGGTCGRCGLEQADEIHGGRWFCRGGDILNASEGVKP